MLSDHMNMNLKRGVKILTCDPQSRTIEAETRNGEVISVNAYSYTPMFRWPVPGEKWIVKEENGSWYLDGIYEPQGAEDSEVQAEPGDAVISSSSGRVLLNQEGKLTQIQTEGSKGKWRTPEKFEGETNFGVGYIPSMIHDTFVYVSVESTSPETKKPTWLVSVAVGGIQVIRTGHGNLSESFTQNQGTDTHSMSFIVPAGDEFVLNLSEESPGGPDVVISGLGFLYSRFE